MNKFRVFLLLLLISQLAGCKQEQIIGRIKIIQYIGMDIQGDTLIGSASYPTYGQDNRKAPLLLLTSHSKTIMGAFTEFSSKSEHPYEYGKIRTLLISEAFAKKGISELAAKIIRDPVVGSNTTVIITKNAKEILEYSLKLSPFFISQLIEQNMSNGNTPLTSIHTLTYQFFGEGQDVYLPVISRDQTGMLQVKGVGVFRADQLKLILSEREGLYLKLLKDKILSGSVEFTTRQKDNLYLKIRYGKRKLSLKPDNHAVVSLKLYVTILNFPQRYNSLNQTDITELEQEIEHQFTTEIRKFLENLQANQTDPVGIGDLYRAKQKHWTEQQFNNETYSRVKFDVNADIILQTGVGR